MFCSVHFVFSFQLFFSSTDTFRLQRWSSRGHILKSLASKLQVLKNCPVLGSRTAVFLESLKFCRSFFVEKLVFWRFFDFVFLRTPEKKNFEDLILLIFLENTCAGVLALERVCPRKGCLWPRIFFFVSLASSLVLSTPRLSHVRLSQMLRVFRVSPISAFI